ncbi:MAG: DUF3667 domain-containing protein, partial [Saprospiraceae bacterium]|nr:DUF3667 domain-containing protein [Saprospiraceae bacterium]
METRTCKTCDAPVVGNYCPACGQRHLGERITLRFIGVELFQMLTNLERGLWHTLLELVRNPGRVIRDYLSGATVLYYQPVRFLLLMTGISALMANLVDFDKIMEMTMSTMNMELTPEQKALQSKMMHNVLRYTNVIMALNVPITSI